MHMSSFWFISDGNGMKLDISLCSDHESQFLTWISLDTSIVPSNHSHCKKKSGVLSIHRFLLSLCSLGMKEWRHWRKEQIVYAIICDQRDFPHCEGSWTPIYCIVEAGSTVSRWEAKSELGPAWTAGSGSTLGLSSRTDSPSLHL